jgi:hypothetical protein
MVLQHAPQYGHCVLCIHLEQSVESGDTDVVLFFSPTLPDCAFLISGPALLICRCTLLISSRTLLVSRCALLVSSRTLLIEPHKPSQAFGGLRVSLSRKLTLDTDCKLTSVTA